VRVVDERLRPPPEARVGDACGALLHEGAVVECPAVRGAAAERGGRRQSVRAGGVVIEHEEKTKKESGVEQCCGKKIGAQLHRGLPCFCQPPYTTTEHQVLFKKRAIFTFYAFAFKLA